jgi:hypothetical protein
VFSAETSSTVSVPADTKFVLQLNLQAFRQTALGERLFAMAKKKAMEEWGDSEEGKGPSLEKLQEVLGFDPFEEIQTVMVGASDYEHPEKSLVASVSLRKTTGNLEGLLLALPGYQAEEFGAYQIHTARPEPDMPVFGAIHTNREGNKTVLVSANREAVVNLLNGLDGKPGGESFKQIKLSADGQPLLALQVLELPKEIAKEGPQANVAKILQALSLQISQSEGNVDVDMSLTAGNEKQAEQLRQMAEGLVALIEVAQSADPEDEDLKRLQRLIQDVKATQAGSALQVRLSVKADELTRLIEEELDDQ